MARLHEYVARPGELHGYGIATTPVASRLPLTPPGLSVYSTTPFAAAPVFSGVHRIVAKCEICVLLRDILFTNFFRGSYSGGTQFSQFNFFNPPPALLIE